MSTIIWAWHGAWTHESFGVSGQASDVGASVRLKASTAFDFSEDPVWSEAVITDENRCFKTEIDGLTPGTQYYWGLEIDGVLSLVIGRGNTFPEPGTLTTFSFATTSCVETGLNAFVFDVIRSRDPAFFLHTGDMHYFNLNDQNIMTYLNCWQTVMSSIRQSNLYRHIPLVYIPDDHDLCGNNCDKTWVGMPAVVAAYRACFSHYPTPVAGLHQAFTYGRVRFIYPDCRTQRSRNNETDDINHSMLGLEGRQWLLDEISAADADPNIVLIVFITSVKWNDATQTGGDGWGGFNTERNIIAQHLTTAEITTQILHVCGDAHVLGIDTGASNVWGGFPSLISSGVRIPVNRWVSTTEVTPHDMYDLGIIGNAYNTQSHAMIDIDDQGSEVTVTIHGLRLASTLVETEWLTHEFTFYPNDKPGPPPPPPPPYIEYDTGLTLSYKSDSGVYTSNLKVVQKT